MAKYIHYMHVSRVGDHKAKGILSNTGSNPLEKYKATKPVFNLAEPSLKMARF